VPAYTDPCRDDRFFAPWIGLGDQRGFTLDPKTFHYGGKMTFYFGTRKIGDPQFRGVDRKTLLIDSLTEHLPESLTIRVLSRMPGQHPVEYVAAVLPPANDAAKLPSRDGWTTLTLQPAAFQSPAKSALPNWDHVECVILNGVSPQEKPPVFKDLRWRED
jgi:hypothetical protein